MPIQIVSGNLLESDCTIIAHQCNCFHTMGAGIAKNIKAKYPAAFAVDTRTGYGDIKKLGTWSVASDKGITIYNLYSQYKYSRDSRMTDYEALARICEALNAQLSKWTKPFKFGIPYNMGCSNAGGNWNIVRTIIEESFKDITVYIYKIE